MTRQSKDSVYKAAIGGRGAGRYGSCSSQNAIAGYVMSGEFPRVVGRIINKIIKNSFVSNLSLDKNSIHPQYLSRHMKESDGKGISLYHHNENYTGTIEIVPLSITLKYGEV